MAAVLVCSTPVIGHINPMVAVAQGLVDRGHDVTFLTGRRFEDRVVGAGASFVPLPAVADFDDTKIDESFPGRVGLKGPKGIRYDLSEVFIRPGKAQYEAVRRVIADRPVDVVLAEPLFMGASLLLAGDQPDRPAVINCGILPLSLASTDTAPFGLGIRPMPGPLGRIRNRVLQLVSERVVFAPVQKYADDVARDTTGATLPTFFMDWPRAADHLVQFTVPEFEYPRSDLPDTVHFVGPVSQGGLRAGDAGAVDLPEWWDELDGDRPVIHVTQGTVANQDFSELVRPAIEGLAHDDVVVVVSTGGRPVEALEGQLPSNVRVSSYLPYDELLPKTDVLVTNGGYGGVHFALRYGVPLVVAGETEDKTEVSARVAWSGAGINLRTKRAKPDVVAKAVRAVLGTPSYREASRRIGASIRESPGVGGLADLVESLYGPGSAR